MTISVIVIVQNTREYLSKCLDSINNQTFKNLEVIVVDDHSEIFSDDIIAQYAQTLNITYHYLSESRGPGGARNFGIVKACGEYLCFLDSDDWLDLDYLYEAEQFMSACKADIGMCGLVRNYDFTVPSPYYKCTYEKVYSLNGVVAFRMLAGQYDYGPIINPSPVNKLYRRSFLKDSKIEFLENVYYEDVLFAFQTLLTDCHVITIPKVYYHHYKRTGSIVQSLTKRHFDDFAVVFTQVKKYLTENDLYTEFGFHYYKILERFYNLLIRQVFQFSKTEQEKKNWMRYSFCILKELIDINEYIEYSCAEDIRKHLQPFIENTSLL